MLSDARSMYVCDRTRAPASDANHVAVQHATRRTIRRMHDPERQLCSPAMPCQNPRNKSHFKGDEVGSHAGIRPSVTDCSHNMTRTSAPGSYNACSGCVMLGVWTPGFSVWDAISRTLVALSPPVCTLMPNARRANSFCPFAA